jgi:hypothetical protein
MSKSSTNFVLIHSPFDNELIKHKSREERDAMHDIQNWDAHCSFIPRLHYVEEHVGGKLLINTMLKTKLIKRGISELSLIVTVNDSQAVGMLIVQPHSQPLKVLKHFILTFQEENPRVPRIIVNDDKNVPLASHGTNPRGTDIVHME